MKPGRKPANESRATLIRIRLIAWRQIPEAQRPSLRALAEDLGTSHQLLSFHLKRLSEWQKKEYQRRAKAIREYAKAEKRPLTQWEQSQMLALERAALQCVIEIAMQAQLKRLAARAADGLLSTQEIRLLIMLGLKGIPEAREIMEKHQSKLGAKSIAVETKTRLDAVLQATDPKQATRLIQQLTSEERGELRRILEKRQNNLPTPVNCCP